MFYRNLGARSKYWDTNRCTLDKKLQSAPTPTVTAFDSLSTHKQTHKSYDFWTIIILFYRRITSTIGTYFMRPRNV